MVKKHKPHMLNGKLNCASIFFGKNMPRHMCLPQWKIGHFRSGLSIETTALDYKNSCVLSSDYLSYRAAFGARVQCGHPRSSKLISMFGSKHKAHLCIIVSSYKGKKRCNNSLFLLKTFALLLVLPFLAAEHANKWRYHEKSFFDPPQIQ